jgi:hypothetical protein
LGSKKLNQNTKQNKKQETKKNLRLFCWFCGRAGCWMEEQKPLNPLISKSESNYAGGNLKWFIPY